MHALRLRRSDSHSVDGLEHPQQWRQCPFHLSSVACAQSNFSREQGGDGQTGDAGQGTEGTDRHNFVQYRAPGENYPMTVRAELERLFTNHSFVLLNILLD